MRPATVVTLIALLLAAAAAATPAPASAAWRVDRAFGAHGVFERYGERWQEPSAALADDAGGLLLAHEYHLLRVTAGGRADAGVDVPLSYDARLVPFGDGRALVHESTLHPHGNSYVSVGHVRVVDRRGQVAPASAGFTAALQRSEGGAFPHHLVPLADGTLADLAFDGDHYSLRTLRASGAAGPAQRIAWPGPWLPSTRVSTAPVRSGGRILVAAFDPGATVPRGIVALTPGGRIDRAWGHDGIAALHELPRRLLAVPGGGAIAVAEHHVSWLDRRGRVTVRRALGVGATAVDAHGRLLVARPGDRNRNVSLLRLDARGRVDRAFGRLTLRASGQVDPVAVALTRDGRVAVVARRVAYEHIEDIREDYTGLVTRGTAIWKVRKA
jgi:hypothetical protein